MTCGNPIIRAERTVWIKRSTSAHFLPFYRSDALVIRGCRVEVELSDLRGPAEVRPAVRYSNDGGFTGSSPVEWGSSYVSSAGWTHGDRFNDIDNDYQMFEVGLNVRNTSGSSAGTARAEMVLATTSVRDLEIGVDVQAFNPNLDTIGGLATTSGNFIVGTGRDWTVKNGHGPGDPARLW